MLNLGWGCIFSLVNLHTSLPLNKVCSASWLNVGIGGAGMGDGVVGYRGMGDGGGAFLYLYFITCFRAF